MTENTQEQEKRALLSRVRLQGITREPEWQCAFLSVPHAVKGKEVFLTWELPGEDDLVLGVAIKSGIVRIRKV